MGDDRSWVGFLVSCCDMSCHVVPCRDQGAGAGSPDWGGAVGAVGPPRGGHQPQMAYDEPRRDSRDSLSRLSRDEVHSLMINDDPEQ